MTTAIAIRVACLALLSVLAGPVYAGSADAPDPAVREQIEYLLDRVEHSGFIFVRNGSEHNGVEAARHMRRKYEYFAGKGDIITVEDFIELAGTKSLMTGRAYTVRLPDDSVLPTAQWLRGQIEARSRSMAEVAR